MFALEFSPEYLEEINAPNFWDNKEHIEKAVGALDDSRLARFTEKVKKIAVKNDIWHVMKRSILSSITEFDTHDDICARFGNFGFDDKLLKEFNLEGSSSEDPRVEYFDELSALFMNDDCSFSDRLFDVAFQKTCEVYLYNRLLKDSTINKNNFLTWALPDADEILSWVGLLGAFYYDCLFQYVNFSKLEDKLNASAKFLQLEKDVKKLNKENEKLQAKLTQLKEKHRKDIKEVQKKALENSMLDSIVAANDELKQKYSKLERKYNALNQRYQEFRDSLGEEADDEFESIDIVSEIDESKQLVFFGDFDDAFKNKLLEAFPNSKVYTTATTKVNIKNCDMGVCIVSCISHNFFYKAKSVCDSANIPLLSTNHRNIDLIKTDIAEACVTTAI